MITSIENTKLFIFEFAPGCFANHYGLLWQATKHMSILHTTYVGVLFYTQPMLRGLITSLYVDYSHSFAYSHLHGNIL